MTLFLYSYQTSFFLTINLGPVCQEFGAWLHVDGAYAGNSFICPENRYLMKGIEVKYVDDNIFAYAYLEIF